ncbi:MAG: hypothetical protein ACKKMW_03140 [Candidatus Nealsonbacteria bacterium]
MTGIGKEREKIVDSLPEEFFKKVEKFSKELSLLDEKMRNSSFLLRKKFLIKKIEKVTAKMQKLYQD